MEAGSAALEQGDYDTAVIEFSVALDIAEKYFSGDPKLVGTHNWLAAAYRGQQNFPEAERHMHLALSYAEQDFGPERTESIPSCLLFSCRPYRRHG